MQGRNSMFRSEQLSDGQWAVVIPNILKQDGAAFIETLRQVANGMQFRLGEPQM